MQGQKKTGAGQQQSPRRSPRVHAAASSPRASAAGPVSAPLVNKPRLGALAWEAVGVPATWTLSRLPSGRPAAARLQSVEKATSQMPRQHSLSKWGMNCKMYRLSHVSQLHFCCAGRVKRCSSKQVELMCIGELRLAAGWHNNGYIFPDGFCTRTVFRSSVCCPCRALHLSRIAKTSVMK